MITAANDAFGMYSKVFVKRPNESRTTKPVHTPPTAVFTPLALLIAVLVKLPVIGIEDTKAEKKFPRPSAIISWVTSRTRPRLKDLAIAMASIIETSGTETIERPSVESILKKL